jgi:hypothetical protein
VPDSDERTEANAVLNQVLTRTTAFNDELLCIANRHADQAPRSSQHLVALADVIARAVLDWITEWPA